MTRTSANPTSSTAAWDGWPLWPFGLLDRAAPAPSLRFDQPINPGWTFGNLISVTEQNSASPDTERDIVAAHSYGRQLGRLMDAVAALIAELPEAGRQAPAFNELLTLRDKIENIKSRAAARRLDRFAADLAELKKSDVAEYRRVAAELEATLAQGKETS
jgi:hypothetical protein